VILFNFVVDGIITCDYRAFCYTYEMLPSLKCTKDCSMCLHACQPKANPADDFDYAIAVESTEKNIKIHEKFSLLGGIT
jgi:hypothetical protein